MSAGGRTSSPRHEPRLSRHWDWRPDWSADDRVWWWYGTFEHDDAVRRLADEAREVLRPDAPVDVVPTRWLHLTLAEVGHSATTPRHLAYEAARTAAPRLSDVGPVQVDVGPVRTMSGAVVLRVRGAGLPGLYRRLLSSLPGELPCRPLQRRFDPHISVAYLSQDCHPSDVLQDDIRSRALMEHSVRTTLEHVTLAEVVRDRTHYRWTPRCRLSLRRDDRERAQTDERPRTLRAVN